MEKKKAGIYGRVSTDKQAKKGLSIERQLQVGHDVCDKNNFEIFKEYVDAGVSGKKSKLNKRHDYIDLLNDIRNKTIEVVVATDLDRVTRSVTNTYQLIEICKQYECELMLDGEFVDLNDPDDKFKLGIKALLAEHEVDKTSARTKNHLKIAAQHGHLVGVAPLGYDKAIKKQTKKLVINKKEALIIQRIYDTYLTGKSILEITKMLNEENCLNRYWSHSTISDILENKLYIGIYEFGKRSENEIEEFKDFCPKIIKKEEFDLVQEQRFKNRQNYNREITYLFMQKIKCPRCHSFMGGAGIGKKNPDWKYYRCNCCSNRKYVRENLLEQQLATFFDDMLDYFKLIDHFSFPATQNDFRYEIEECKSTLEELDRKEVKIRKMIFNSDEVAEDDFIDEFKYIKNNKKEVEEKLMELQNKHTKTEVDGDYDLYLVKSEFEKRRKTNEKFVQKNIWKSLTEEQKQKIVLEYIDYIDISYTSRGIELVNVEIKKIKILDILYLFRKKVLDLYMEVDNNAILISNSMSEVFANEHLSRLRKH